MTTSKVHLYTFYHGEMTHKIVALDDKGLVDGETPIEDYGDFIYSEEELDDPFRVLIELA